MQYSKELMEHYENPRNVGSFPDDEPGVGTGMVGNPACGDVMKLQLKVSDDDVVVDAKFKTFGCGSAIASSSLVTEMVKGKTIKEALEIKNLDLVTRLSLPPLKIHCSVLAEEALQAALKDLDNKRKLAGHNGRTQNTEEAPASTQATAQVQEDLSYAIKSGQCDGEGCPNCSKKQ